MIERLKYYNFNGLEHYEKVMFLDNFDIEQYPNTCEKEIKPFFRQIYENSTNSYLRQKVVDIVIELTLTEKVNCHYTVDFLHDIDDNEDAFVLVSSIKGLYFFHHIDQTKIEKRLYHFSNHNNSEICSESYYRLGLLSFFNIPTFQTVDGTNLVNVLKAKQLFSSAFKAAENRIDAEYFYFLSDFILGLLTGSDNIQITNEEIFKRLTRLKLFGIDELSYNLDISVYEILQSCLEILKKTVNQPQWIDFAKELNSLFILHHNLNAVEPIKLINKNRIENLRDFINETIIKQYYNDHLSGQIARIDSLIAISSEQKTFYDYLNSLRECIINPDKKKDFSKIIPLLIDRIPNILESDIQSLNCHVEQIQNNPHEIIPIIDIIGQYIEKEDLSTGFTIGNEILSSIRSELVQVLNNFEREKEYSTLLVLKDIINYFMRANNEQKMFFPELFGNALSEKEYQKSVFKNLRIGNRAEKYQWEPNSNVAGGRNDIFYKDDHIGISIEVKKTETKLTFDDIEKQFISQAQTYAHSQSQIGILLVFDASDKSKHQISPLNNIRELVKVIHKKPYYNLPSTFPDYVVSFIIPANRIHPSEMTKYS